MALRDWKKVGDIFRYKKSKNKLIHFYKRGKLTEVVIEKDFGQLRETFKTKAQALKFAKSYMRRH